jgi:hypothetical protein
MNPLLLFVDPYLIWYYRLTGYPGLNFILGTAALALQAMLLGKLTICLASWIASKYLEGLSEEARKYHDLSIKAMQIGDQKSYQATNKLANEAFGRVFFMQMAHSAAFFWPIFFALAWMETRFADLAFPLPVGHISLNYILVFFLLYISAYFLVKWVKYKLPYFCRIKKLLDIDDHPEGVMKIPDDQSKIPLVSAPASTPARDQQSLTQRKV